MYSIGSLMPFFSENDLFDAIMTSDPTIIFARVVVQVPVTLTKFDRNLM